MTVFAQNLSIRRVGTRWTEEMMIKRQWHSRCDCDACFGSWLRPRSTPAACPLRRGNAFWDTEAGQCCIADAVGLDAGRAVVTDGGAYFDCLTNGLERHPVDEVPRSDMLRHDVRESLDSRPTQQEQTNITHNTSMLVKGKRSPYSITESTVSELISVLGSQPAGDVSHKPGGRLPLLSARPAVTPTTLKRDATNFAAWCTEAQWVWTVCLRLLPDSIAAAIWTQALLRLSPAYQSLGYWASTLVHRHNLQHLQVKIKGLKTTQIANYFRTWKPMSIMKVNERRLIIVNLMIINLMMLTIWIRTNKI